MFDCYEQFGKLVKKCGTMLMVRGVGGRKALLVLLCVLAPFVFIFLLVRSGGSSEPGSCQIFTSREVRLLKPPLRVRL